MSFCSSAYPHQLMPSTDMHSLPFPHTSSIDQLNPSPPPNKGVKGCGPQLVVIGFDVGEQGNKQGMEECESARERGAYCNSAHSDQAKSPRSVLGSLLAEQKVYAPVADGDGEHAKACEDEQELKSPLFLPAVRYKTPNETKVEKSEGVCADMDDANDASEISMESLCVYGVDDLDIDENDHQESIFCAASPFSTSCSLDISGRDFLSVCFFCKGCLTNGKDVYMYKGNKAFCSSECRYQQIVLDEFRERQSASASCFIQPSNQSSKLYSGASTAAA